MKLFLALLLAGCPLLAFGQIEILAAAPQLVFAAPAGNLRIQFHNPTDRLAEAKLKTHLYQTSATTVMPVGEVQAWKSLSLLPKQTVLDFIKQDFPAVRAPTRFQLNWLDEKQTILGKTGVIVYPDDLLKKLSLLAKEKPIGMLDPNKELTPVLARQKVEIKELANSAAVEECQEQLIIVGPFSTTSQMRKEFPELNKRVTSKARAGTAIVWFQPSSDTLEPVPPAYIVRVGLGAVLVAPSSTVADFAQSPASQLNLLRYAELALQPEKLQLPQTEP